MLTTVFLLFCLCLGATGSPQTEAYFCDASYSLLRETSVVMTTPSTTLSQIDMFSMGEDSLYNQSLPFPIEYFGRVYDYVQISPQGYIQFSDTQAVNAGWGISENVAAVFWLTAIINIERQIYVGLLEGIAPNRVFSIQFVHTFKTNREVKQVTGEVFLSESDNILQFGYDIPAWSSRLLLVVMKEESIYESKK